MLTGLTSMSVGDLIANIRDFVFLAGILILGWKARALIQPAIDFFNNAQTTMTRANQHFDVMEEGMSTLLTNHLKHIESDLAKLTGREVVAHEDDLAGA